MLHIVSGKCPWALAAATQRRPVLEWSNYLGANAHPHFVPQTKNTTNEAILTDVCETLMLDVIVLEVHQNDCNYVHEFSGPTFDSRCNDLAWWAVTWRTS